MPPRSETLPGGILKLTKLLEHLNASPKLSLFGVKRLRVSLASQNDHFGARHFVKEDLPRIRWANPNLEIHVHREMKSPKEQWKAHMEVELQNGPPKKLDMQDKWSSTILKELMDIAGGEPWKRHVQTCASTGAPLFPSTPLAPAASLSPSASPSSPSSPTSSPSSSSPDTLPLDPSSTPTPHLLAKAAKSAKEGSTSALPTLDEFLEKYPQKREEHLRVVRERVERKEMARERAKVKAQAKGKDVVPPPTAGVGAGAGQEAAAPPP
ncbi:hypothetical protein CVT26_007769 [Gymnopilus dilepis]|uniref:Ribosomal protein/NADH dehydrogenase domain-containing protein n=1 Tax=Gymnopilus dilepis TaxID=231916 RepID=A0A409X2P9_9AGAR|nr:hypothetical protein CVT26_007769 [Gymnopilus dilepis]